MRFLHTGDWHLGRLFHGSQLTDDQRHVLDQLVALAADARPDVVLVAGDVYDRAVPPPEAVELLDEVLSRLVLDLKLPVVLIAGNHDSPGRLHFGSRLLAGRRLYVTGNLPARCEPLVLGDADGQRPFLRRPVCRARDGAGVHGLRRPRRDPRPQHRHAAGAGRGPRLRTRPACARWSIAHAFVAGGSGSESERPLSVGGAGTVDGDCFAGFHYAALGHLHRPQSVGAEHAALLRLDPQIQLRRGGRRQVRAGGGNGRRRRLPPRGGGAVAAPRRPQDRGDAGRVVGSPGGDAAGTAGAAGAADDYLEVTLLDAGPVPDAIGRLRQRYRNVMSIRRPDPPARRRRRGGRPEARSRVLDDAVLFRSFFAHVCGTELSAEQQLAYAEVVEEMHRRERAG